ncbi:MAG: class I SAM-dependent methyltransferase [Saprospiraceae bacterium]|nr:class I SAM-dependent methyltransferase [Saprospiraceae bacterium]MCF8249579.1 class I SAM-dependent methyltransferase [Saprospiraceae bacterium]MCF8280479.1 class I SAM-dependent methyltransferase [Bacteroidales bacterium]MCF8310411.1 class I SAM-dependent methyltransferase [Saprospiraceae bacterium]MCF8439789.1 class I SAM-dependent methyltransferase [Saprospiraceae bacterium]
MKAFYNERYRQPDYAYGELPNEYLKTQLPKFTVGSILFPAEGEGRNAVYAASLGWEVSAFDISEEGQKKAQQLASKRQVALDYQVSGFESLPYLPEQFDAIALIYAHFPTAMKPAFFRILNTYLRKHGVVIFEAFSKKHIAYNSVNEKAGGPKDLDMLYSIEEIKTYFNDFEIIELMEQEVTLQEGLYHNGAGAVIRFVGRKK